VLLRAATRGSPLALWQTRRVLALLSSAHAGLDTELVVVQTSGDIDLTTPIDRMGGRGVFVKEVQAAVLDGRADIAVHSAKDMMSESPEGLTVGAFPERGDVRDGLVGSTLADLAVGATIATGSIRRKAQLAGLRPDLVFVGLRGNMTTRLSRLDDVDALVVACAGLDRLGLAHKIAERLPVAKFVPQVTQGTLAVECRSDDSTALEMLTSIDDRAVRRVATAERAYLRELGGGCDLPVGAFATLGAENDVSVEGLLSSFDGGTILRLSLTGDDPVDVGRSVARALLDDMGGAALLEARH